MRDIELQNEITDHDQAEQDQAFPELEECEGCCGDNCGSCDYGLRGGA